MIMEERAEVVASGTSSKSNRARTGHFLEPSNATSSDDDIPVLSHKNKTTITTTTTTTNNNNDYKAYINDIWPFKVSFSGMRCPQRKWKLWVNSMLSLHQSLWKQAGIYDAVTNSVHSIFRDNALIYAFALKWCPQTNTFLLPWGEITPTLEDIMILGGYSVMGIPVFEEIKLEHDERQLLQLIKARQEITRSKAQKASHNAWLKKFMDTGSDIEHQAFLAVWLSRFVFPCSSEETISKNVFSIAILLAKGTKMALAPAVLATIYRDLSLLKGSIHAASSRKSSTADESTDFKDIVVKICAPLQILQTWAWERFPALSPKPKFAHFENLRLAMDSSSQNFLWRPYAARAANGRYKRLYGRERYVAVDCDLDEDFESWVRCVRVSELVGPDNDTIEAYLPHRVAMQFGLDQDVPIDVQRANTSRTIAWRNYTRPIEDELVYIPSRLVEPNVTARYLEWWKRSRLCEANGEVSLVKRRSTSAIKISTLKVKHQDLKVDDDVPPGFSSKCSKAVNEADDDEDTLPLTQCMRAVKNVDDIAPPGFCPKCSKPIEEANDVNNIPFSLRVRTVQNDDGIVPPSLCPKRRKLAENASDDEDNFPKARRLRNAQKASNVAFVPPGFRPECSLAAEASDDDDSPIAPRIRTIQKAGDADAKPSFNPKGSLAAEEATDDEDMYPISRVIRTKLSGKGRSTKLVVDNATESEHLAEGLEVKARLDITTDRIHKGECMLSIDDDCEKEGSSSNHAGLNDEMMNGVTSYGMEPLEARIYKLEKVVSQIKATRAKYSVRRLQKTDDAS